MESKAPTAHKHLLLKARMEHVPLALSTEPLGEEFLRVIVEDVLHMNIAIAPRCHFVQDEGNKGLTGIVCLTTSHASFHHWSETGLLMLDVYSCKNYVALDVASKVKQLLKDGDIYDLRFHMIHRDRDSAYNIQIL